CRKSGKLKVSGWRSPCGHDGCAFMHGSTGDRDAPDFARRLIVIVDDDAGVRGALNRLISAFGYAATTFATAEEYLFSDLIRDTDCLISDVQLPGMSGPDLQAQLIADGYRIPTVFITGFFSETIRARVLKAGAIDYLAKPYNAKYLLACIEKAT